MLGKDRVNRIKKDAEVYKPVIAAKGLQTTSQTWRLIDWARQLPVRDWHKVGGGVGCGSAGAEGDTRHQLRRHQKHKKRPGFQRP